MQMKAACSLPGSAGFVVSCAWTHDPADGDTENELMSRCRCWSRSLMLQCCSFAGMNLEKVCVSELLWPTKGVKCGGTVEHHVACLTQLNVYPCWLLLVLHEQASQTRLALTHQYFYIYEICQMLISVWFCHQYCFEKYCISECLTKTLSPLHFHLKWELLQRHRIFCGILTMLLV